MIPINACSIVGIRTVLADAKLTFKNPVTVDGKLRLPDFQRLAYAESCHGVRWMLPTLYGLCGVYFALHLCLEERFPTTVLDGLQCCQIHPECLQTCFQ